MDDKTFYERLASALQSIKDEYELADKHDALIFWYLRFKFDLDESDLKDRIVRDMHAEGVDALILDSRQRTFYFVQGKSSDAFDGVTRNLGENEVKKTLSGTSYLLNGDYKGHITPELENFVDEYHDFDRSGDYQTKVLFLIEKKPPVSDKFINDFKHRHPKVDVEIIDFSGLKSFYETEYLVFRASPPPKISFEISGVPHQKEQPLAISTDQRISSGSFFVPEPPTCLHLVMC
jgi:hypothetical protein